MAITTVKDYVYRHLVDMYSKIAIETFEYLTPEISAIVQKTAYDELIQMAQGGYLNNYYERLLKGAV